MAEILRFHSLFLISILFNFLVNTSSRETGFSVDLIHRDSPDSPLYNPFQTHAERQNHAFHRFFSNTNRLNYLTKSSSNSPNTVTSEITPESNAEYLLKFSVGTPGHDIYGIMDTGSDLEWTQCQPCNTCYKQTTPVYDPRKSSTYRDIPCQSQQCHLLDTASCPPGTQNTCAYSYGYGGGALTTGFLAEETITFSSNTDQPVFVKNIVFGCGHNNSGGFIPAEMGLIGLGKGPLSLINQIGSSFGSKTFSHCLVPYQNNVKASSKMRFGFDSEVSGPGVVSTPLVSGPDKTYYYVTLLGISVGNKFLPYSSNSSQKGNVFIDSGTSPIILPQEFYNRLVGEVKGAVGLGPVKDPDLSSQLCYTRRSLEGLILTAHFDGNADVKLATGNIFVEAKDGVFCFGMVSTIAEVGIFGSQGQKNVLVGFDLDKGTVSFKPTDCAKE